METSADILTGLVRCLHVYHLTDLESGVHIGAPGPAVVWVIDLDGSYRLDAEGTTGVQRFASSVSGLSMRAAAVHHGHVQSGLYIELSLAQTRSVFGVPAAELAHQTVELSELWGRRADRLLDRLHSAPPADRASVLATDLRSHTTNRRQPPEDSLWELTIQRGLSPSQVTQASGWSPRHLRRMMRTEAGITLQDARRLARFEKSLADVRGGVSLAIAAARHGYADQSHLSRDWHDLLGTTPTEYLRREG